MNPSEAHEIAAALANHAPALYPLVVADPAIVTDVLERPLERRETAESLSTAFLDATNQLEDGPDLRKVLRKLRHRAIIRIALREILRIADVDQTSEEMADLASAALEAALRACTRTALHRFGVPLDASSRVVPLTVLGMGKLGGGELNLGSDIDLCFFYETDDATVTGSSLTVHEYYTRVVAQTTQALSEVTEDGFCFRVDLRLRPEGTRGPLVNSLASAERYYEAWGRTWERAALLRARAVAGDIPFGRRLLEALRPFVFRRAVKPSISQEMGDLLLRTRRELAVDERRNIKLGRGGIRTAEFFVQSLQLIWGGQHPELQVQNTMRALQRLEAAGLVSDREARELSTAWALLRRLEHRIHMQVSHQTHDIPERGPGRTSIATSLGWPNDEAFITAVETARERVARLFESLGVAEPAAAEDLLTLCDRVAAGANALEIATLAQRTLGVVDADEAAAHLVRLGRRASAPLGPVARERLPDLGPLLLREVAETADPDSALRFLAEFFSRLGGPWAYDRTLLEEPRLTRRLIGLFGASATLSSALVGHPEQIDYLLFAQGTPTAQNIRDSHAAMTESEANVREPEAFVSALRSVKRETTLRVGLAHTSGELSLRDVERLLTRLAECQIAAAHSYAWSEMMSSLGPRADEAVTLAQTSGMVVCGLGKLGAGELGFGGDLDLMFLYDSDVPWNGGGTFAASELFTRVAQRTMRHLSQADAEGPGYQTDARLRPSGSHGMLVVSLASFDRYHAAHAAAWERQALTRARPIAGDPALFDAVQERFERLAYEEPPPSAEDIARMRGRIERELARESPRRYHAKLGFGAIVDVEFLVQWTQMRHGHDRRVRKPNTLDALEVLATLGHLPRREADALREGYDFFRSVEQALKLLDDTREAALDLGGRVIDQVARRLGLRNRDGRSPSDVLLTTYRAHAREIRSIFEAHAGPIGQSAPWENR